MKITAAALLLFFAALVPNLACAAEDDEAPPAKTPAKTASKNEKEGAWIGKLAPRDLDAGAGVVARVEIVKGDKVEWLDVFATGEVAKKIETWAEKHAKVALTGSRTAEGLKVTAISDDIKPAPQGKKKKKK